MKPLNIGRQEFIVKFVADLAKAVFAVGLASYFFKDMLPAGRLAMGALFFILASLSVMYYPKEGGG